MTLFAHGALPGSPIWLPHNPTVWGTLALAGLIYLKSAKARNLDTGPPPTGRQKAALLSGLGVLWASLDGPVEALSGSLYIFHMIQHLLVTLVAPPLILLGLQPWMFRKILANRRLFQLLRRVSRPIFALVIFNAALAFSHAPGVVELMLRSDGFHYAVHALLLATATLMWLPVVSPVPEIPRLSYPLRMGYLLLQSVVPTIPASFLTFGSQPLYPVYSTLAPQWGMTALTDQQISGLIMKIGGGLILWGIVTALFFRWASSEDRKAVPPEPETELRSVPKGGPVTTRVPPAGPLLDNVDSPAAAFVPQSDDQGRS